MKNKICFIAQFPPPIHGLSKAIDTLYKSKLNEEYEFEKINITNNKKFIYNLIKIFKSKATLFYFTISQTKGGNLRDLIILKLLKKQHKKCLIHLHGGYYRNLIDNDLPKWQKKANYEIIRKLDGVIVLGDSLRYIFDGMIDEDKIYIVPNCIDDEFLMNEKEKNIKIKNLNSKKIKNILYLSNFIKEKGYEDVLELASLEKERFLKTGKRKFNFNFAGEFFNEKDRKDFFDYIEKNNLQNYVNYCGIVKGKEKKKLLSESDIFILLTKYPKEGQPISIIEAMGNCLFIVTTNHAGIPDLIKNGVNGLMIEKAYNVNNLYNELIKMDDKKISNCCLNGYNVILKNYEESKYIDNMKKIFDNILN